MSLNPPQISALLKIGTPFENNPRRRLTLRRLTSCAVLPRYRLSFITLSNSLTGRAFRPPARCCGSGLDGWVWTCFS